MSINQDSFTTKISKMVKNGINEDVKISIQVETTDEIVHLDFLNYIHEYEVRE